MSLTMQRLLPTVVLPVVALAGVGALLHKGNSAAVDAPPAAIEEDARHAAQISSIAPAPRAEGKETASESCAITSGAAVDATRVVCLTSARPGIDVAQLRLHDLSCVTCAPEPITELDEHISGFGVTSDGKHIVFVSDAASAGRSGNFSLFRYDIDTRRRAELTPDDALDRDAPRLPRKHPDLAIYSARAQGESQTKVFVQPIGGEKAKLVYVDPEPGELVDVSDDGTRGVYRRFISPEKSVYIAIELRKRES